MSLIGNAIRSNCFLRNTKPGHGISLLMRDSPRRFSTEAEPPQDSSPDPFLQTPDTGLVYGKLTGTNKYTLKTDVINLLEGCNLTMDDVKVLYLRMFVPVGMMVQFPSRNSYDIAVKAISKKRLYRLDRADRSQWDILQAYNGKSVLLQGIPRIATNDELDRFLSGCEYDASSIQWINRSSFPEKFAVVHFPSQTQAMNAFITKNRSFCLSNQVLVRVLQ